MGINHKPNGISLWRINICHGNYTVIYHYLFWRGEVVSDFYNVACWGGGRGGGGLTVQ
jgi:hypothetical protein